MRLFTRFMREESGQDLIEYALLSALISLVSIVALQTLGPAIANLFTTVTAALTT